MNSDYHFKKLSGSKDISLYTVANAWEIVIALLQLFIPITIMNLIVSDVDINGKSSIIMITSCISVVYFIAKGVARCFRLQQEVFSNRKPQIPLKSILSEHLLECRRQLSARALAACITISAFLSLS